MRLMRGRPVRARVPQGDGRVMTATTADTSLDWVTFAGQDDTEPCSFNAGACSMQATHVGYYEVILFLHPPAQAVLRGPCGVLVRRHARDLARLFHCSICGPESVKRLIRVVTL